MGGDIAFGESNKLKTSGSANNFKVYAIWSRSS